MSDVEEDVKVDLAIIHANEIQTEELQFVTQQVLWVLETPGEASGARHIYAPLTAEKLKQWLTEFGT